MTHPRFTYWVPLFLLQACLRKLDIRLKKLLSSVSEKAVVVVILGGRTLQDEVNHAMAFAKVT